MISIGKVRRSWEHVTCNFKSTMFVTLIPLFRCHCFFVRVFFSSLQFKVISWKSYQTHQNGKTTCALPIPRDIRRTLAIACFSISKRDLIGFQLHAFQVANRLLETPSQQEQIDKWKSLNHRMTMLEIHFHFRYMPLPIFTMIFNLAKTTKTHICTRLMQLPHLNSMQTPHRRLPCKSLTFYLGELNESHRAQPQNAVILIVPSSTAVALSILMSKSCRWIEKSNWIQSSFR